MRGTRSFLAFFSVARGSLAEIRPSCGEFGNTKVLGPEIPITAVLGDQQASLFGQGCVDEGSMKCTFGTGAFWLVNTGEVRRDSKAGLLATVGWVPGENARAMYALEGSVFIAGALIGWLRDNLGLIASSAESAELAAQVEDSAGVYIVPAFVGLGSPHWDERARGTILGLTRDSRANHIVRAALEAVAHQVVDIVEAEGIEAGGCLRIDGGYEREQGVLSGAERSHPVRYRGRTVYRDDGLWRRANGGVRCGCVWLGRGGV